MKRPALFRRALLSSQATPPYLQAALPYAAQRHKPDAGAVHRTQIDQG